MCVCNNEIINILNIILFVRKKFVCDYTNIEREIQFNLSRRCNLLYGTRHYSNGSLPLSSNSDSVTNTILIIFYIFVLIKI